MTLPRGKPSLQRVPSVGAGHGSLLVHVFRREMQPVAFDKYTALP
jgi:hypothetical protein